MSEYACDPEIAQNSNCLVSRDHMFSKVGKMTAYVISLTSSDLMLGLGRTSHRKDMDQSYQNSKWLVQRTTQLGPIGISLGQNSLISDKKLISKSLRIHEQKFH